MHHQDPFDRIIVAQAITEPAHLHTVDRKLAPIRPLFGVGEAVHTLRPALSAYSATFEIMR
jgi:hypothetical protein